MYARIAHFESDPESMERGLESMRESLDQGRSARASGQVPEEMRGLEGISRVLVLVDRSTGGNVSIVFCDTEDELRQADEALNRMSPEGGTSRTSVGLYEVAIDQAMR